MKTVRVKKKIFCFEAKFFFRFCLDGKRKEVVSSKQQQLVADVGRESTWDGGGRLER